LAIQISELEATTAYRAKDCDYWHQLFVAQRCVHAVWTVKESSQQLGRYAAPVALNCIPQDVGFDDCAVQVVLNKIHPGCVPDLKADWHEKKRAATGEESTQSRRWRYRKGHDETSVREFQCDKLTSSLIADDE
jgi:hypothetical protein